MADFVNKAITELLIDDTQAKKAMGNMEKSSKKTENQTKKTTKAQLDYNSALDGMVDSLSFLPAGLASSLKGIIGMTKGMKGLKIAIAATGIGLLVISLGALFTWFNRSSEGQEKLAVGMAVLGQVVNIFVDALADYGKFLFKLFTDPLAAIKDLGTAIKDSFNFTKQAEKAKELVDSLKEAAAIQVATNDLNREKLAFITKEAELENEIANARLQANDETNTLAEQIDGINTAQEKTSEIYSQRKAIIQEEIDLLIRSQDLSLNQIADNEELQQMKASLIKLSKSEDDAQRSLIRRTTTLRNEEASRLEEKRKAQQAIWEEQKKRDDEALVGIQDLQDRQEVADAMKIEDAQLRADTLTEIERVRLQKTLDDTKLTNNEKVLLQLEFDERIAEIETEKDEILAEKKAIADQLVIDEHNAKLERDEQAFASLQTLYDRQEIEEANRITNAKERQLALIQIEKDRLLELTDDTKYTFAEIELAKEESQERMDVINQDFADADVEIWRKAEQQKTDNNAMMYSIIKSAANENTVFGKAMAIADVLINTIQGIMKTIGQMGWWGIPFAALIGVMGAKSISDIVSTPIPSAGRGMILSGSSHENGGMLINAEGGEAIINKNSMADPYLRGLASQINVAGGGVPFFARGGIVPGEAQANTSSFEEDMTRALQNAPPVLVTEDLDAVNNRVRVTEEISTL